MILRCEHGFYKGRVIMCKKRGKPCAFMKMCELTGKFMQTKGAETCNERGKNNE